MYCQFYASIVNATFVVFFYALQNIAYFCVMEGRLAQLQEFLKESPNDPFLKYALTMEYVKLGEEDQALAGFEDLLSAHEDYVGTYYHFGKFLESKHEQDRAIEIYEKGMQIAQQKRNFHALGELRNAHLAATGLLDEDE